MEKRYFMQIEIKYEWEIKLEQQHLDKTQIFVSLTKRQRRALNNIKGSSQQEDKILGGNVYVPNIGTPE